MEKFYFQKLKSILSIFLSIFNRIETAKKTQRNCKETAEKLQRNRKEGAKNPQGNSKETAKILKFYIILFSLFKRILQFYLSFFFYYIFFLLINHSYSSFFTRAFELYLTLVYLLGGYFLLKD